MWRSQVGTGSRSEKIRTYKDNRVTDHRLGQNFTLNPVLEGEVEDLIQFCVTQDQQERLEELASEASTATSI